MAIINLRKHYYPLYTKDTFIEVPDEVAEAIIEGQRMERREDGKKTYHGVYSLDASVGMENHAMFLAPSPEDILVEMQEQAEYEELLARLYEAISQLSPTQARRVCAYYLGGLTQQQIADREHVHNSNVCLSIRRGLCNLRRYYADHPQGK